MPCMNHALIPSSSADMSTAAENEGGSPWTKSSDDTFPGVSSAASRPGLFDQPWSSTPLEQHKIPSSGGYAGHKSPIQGENNTPIVQELIDSVFRLGVG